jgi:hypothetical protein
MNRATLSCLVAFAVGVGACPRAVGQSARDVVQKAIDAHGGAALLKQYPACKLSAKGTFHIMGRDVVFESAQWAQAPDKYKNVLMLSLEGQTVAATQVYNAGKVTFMVGDKAQTLSEAQIDDIKQNMHSEYLCATLLPLLDEKNVTLSLIGKADKVLGRDVVGIVAKSSGYKDVKLFFDKKTHLLAKTERKGIDPDQKAVVCESFFLEYKKLDGIVRGIRFEDYDDGKLHLEMTITDYRHLERIDPKEFAIDDR